MKKTFLSPDLLRFFETNPDLFVRCDDNGEENQTGDFWRARVQPFYTRDARHSSGG